MCCDVICVVLCCVVLCCVVLCCVALRCVVLCCVVLCCVVVLWLCLCCGCVCFVVVLCCCVCCVCCVVLCCEMKEFCEIYNLENLIKHPTCYKRAANPSSIDIMLTNKTLNFQNSMTVETGLPDFHKMTITVLKKHFKKKDPIIITYRDLKLFDGLKFREEIRNQPEQSEKLNVTDFQRIFVSTWNSHAPV